MQSITKLIRRCSELEISAFGVLVRSFWLHLMSCRIVCGPNVKIIGRRNIHTSGPVTVALTPVGFSVTSDTTLLRVRGTLIFSGKFAIGRGCRFDISANATANFGSGYVTADTKFVITDFLRIGDDCAISWDCLFLDSDFHTISYKNQHLRLRGIEIGKKVWIGCGVKILKGARIPDGCVVAAGSIVISAFDEPNCLIAGQPAKISRRNIEWY
jgi:acetyltransferase-like isoleucine patch superfamily enzyme